MAATGQVLFFSMASMRFGFADKICWPRCPTEGRRETTGFRTGSRGRFHLGVTTLWLWLGAFGGYLTLAGVRGYLYGIPTGDLNDEIAS